ncbi:hypothetical protein KRX54_05575 [Actinomycetaceae bacterium TAE3-ERU4]|nr:hypothetical protein [Actinomycetaceae bacterium TAE3-ERU4]
MSHTDKIAQQITTLLVHRPLRHPGAWWKSAVIADIPSFLGSGELSWITNNVHSFARAGCNAIVFRPAKLDFISYPLALKQLIQAANRSGLKTIIRLSGLTENPCQPFTSSFVGYEEDPQRTLQRAKVALRLGATGIDLGLLPQIPCQSSPSVLDSKYLNDEVSTHVRALHRICYEQTSSSFISAFALGSEKENFDKYLDNYLYHHLRDETLLETPWEAKAIRERIERALERRDELGHVCAWRASSSITELKQAPHPGAWFEENSTVRRAGLTLLSLALPGAVYIRANRLVELPWLKNEKEYSQISSHERQAAGNRLIQAQRLRANRQIGIGSLAWIGGLEWASPDLFVQVGANTMTVLNTTENEVLVPTEMKVLLTSHTGITHDSADANLLLPGECGWFAFNS